MNSGAQQRLWPGKGGPQHSASSRDNPAGGETMSQYALRFGQWLQAAAYALSKPREIAIVGDPGSADTQALLEIVREGYRPFQVVALGPPHANCAPTR